MNKAIGWAATLLALVISTTALAADRVLMVVSSHQQMGDTQEKTGFWMAELTHPYFALTRAGLDVDVASIAGGMAPVDPRSLAEPDSANQRFLNNPATRMLIDHSKVLAKVDPKDYKAVVFVGGHGTMWDFPNNPAVNRIAARIYDKGGVVAAVCHGPAALLGITLKDGSKLLAGKQVTGFANTEEDEVGLSKVVPFSLQDQLIEAGARYSKGLNWQPKVVVDGRLITGQNPASAHQLGLAVAKAVKGA
ncbi:type 1 glutamine amidotransferase domain-containing protein [Gallaecimonas xiamenensis]|uniref:ThiJ/PfpI family protein n=1 Tax=Gallaecimonas xiamenensis 3-C-1 TaxID=745411 RepID=K2J3K7_9GAMM|nr:type 1 glutamine amidotransferase domain-containing protein [Gallaecimonas xiamenensis]EKE69477.1 ThiJ/PfpI family protein [Gallaecimonas xiamenensis 3-C-1]